jgi:hypothetical protein
MTYARFWPKDVAGSRVLAVRRRKTVCRCTSATIFSLFSPEDDATAARIRYLADVLRAQAAALQDYWETGDKADLQKYLPARDEARTGCCCC